MLIAATHGTDGVPLDAAITSDAPLIAWLDEPSSAEVSVSARLIRCRGWALSRSGRTVRIGARVDEGPWCEANADEERPDVVGAMGGAFPARTSRCGFQLVVPLPDLDGTYSVTLRIEDGAHSGERRLQVRTTASPPRADYKSTWEEVSGDASTAALAVAGYTDETELRRTAEALVQALRDTTGLRPDDVVLEIGAGVGRVGPAIAPLVRRWIAADVSTNMLGHAAERCAGLDNVEFVEVNGWDLAPIADESLDLVYCTVVFMHLDEWERFSYVREAMRVLRPGGRLYVDNVNLRSEEGWAFFMQTLNGYHPLDRPPNISKSSTAEELRQYLRQAGFLGIRIAEDPVRLWISVWGEKGA